MLTITQNHQYSEIPKLAKRSDDIAQDELPTTEKLNELNLRLQKLKTRTALLDSVELSEYAIRKLTRV